MTNKKYPVRPIRRIVSTAVVACLIIGTLIMLPTTGTASQVADGLGISVEAASAHTNGGPATGGGQWHWWSSNGCSKAPNWIPGIYNFTHACQHHDGCYHYHWGSRATCDQWFLNDMLAGCGSWNLSCRKYAYVYYGFVRNFGESSYSAWAWSGPNLA